MPGSYYGGGQVQQRRGCWETFTTVAGLGRFSKEAIRLRCLSLTVKGAVTKNTQLLREYSQAASHG